MTYDGIVLDLDDTLYDTSGNLLPDADRRAVAALRAHGAALGADAALARVAELRQRGEAAVFRVLAAEAGAPQSAAEAAERAFFAFDVPPLELDPDVVAALAELRRLAPVFVLTTGDPKTQARKVERLGIGPRVDGCIYVDRAAAGGKQAALAGLVRDRGWRPERVVLAGDRTDGDVRAANRNGCLAVLVRRDGAEFSGQRPELPEDVPWRTCRHVRELPALLRAER